MIHDRTTQNHADPGQPITDATVPRRLRPDDVAERYGISPRLARDWMRRLVTCGTAVKVGQVIMAAPADVDAWVRRGGQPARTRDRTR